VPEIGLRDAAAYLTLKKPHPDKPEAKRMTPYFSQGSFLFYLTPDPSPKERGVGPEISLHLSLSYSPLSFGEGSGVR
jgi:hypothetical protein